MELIPYVGLMEGSFTLPLEDRLQYLANLRKNAARCETGNDETAGTADPLPAVLSLRMAVGISTTNRRRLCGRTKQNEDTRQRIVYALHGQKAAKRTNNLQPEIGAPGEETGWRKQGTQDQVQIRSHGRVGILPILNCAGSAPHETAGPSMTDATSALTWHLTKATSAT